MLNSPNSVLNLTPQPSNLICASRAFINFNSKVSISTKLDFSPSEQIKFKQKSVAVSSFPECFKTFFFYVWTLGASTYANTFCKLPIWRLPKIVFVLNINVETKLEANWVYALGLPCMNIVTRRIRMEIVSHLGVIYGYIRNLMFFWAFFWFLGAFKVYGVEYVPCAGTQPNIGIMCQAVPLAQCQTESKLCHRYSALISRFPYK